MQTLDIYRIQTIAIAFVADVTNDPDLTKDIARDSLYNMLTRYYLDDLRKVIELSEHKLYSILNPLTMDLSTAGADWAIEVDYCPMALEDCSNILSESICGNLELFEKWKKDECYTNNELNTLKEFWSLFTNDLKAHVDLKLSLMLGTHWRDSKWDMYK